uniref:Uncharacterized protein n=1 Tax=Rhizophora mucronata TaxID=61149 RepID=A0A2P2N3L3_RHIMU
MRIDPCSFLGICCLPVAANMRARLSTAITFLISHSHAMAADLSSENNYRPE